MRKLSKALLVTILGYVFLLSACTEKQDNTVYYNNDNLHYSGRIEYNTQDSSSAMYWPGNAVSISFKGTDISVLLKDINGKNYFNIILDDSVSLLHTKKGKKWYTLANNLKDTIHTIEVFRRMTSTPIYFYAFKTNIGGEFLKTPKKSRSIEFYGNSITEGASNLDYSGKEPEVWDSIYSDNYLSYGAITARHFDAEYSCIARGGIGLMLSWYPLTMPQMYNRLNPDDSTSKWDFTKNIPDIVVINLFQNDAALVNRPEHPQFKAHFGKTAPDSTFIINSYYDFLKNIRAYYPDAKIICTLGAMNATRKDLPWRGYVKSAVDKMEDDNIYTYFFFYKGGYFHPKAEEHKRMADSLINFIDRERIW